MLHIINCNSDIVLIKKHQAEKGFPIQNGIPFCIFVQLYLQQHHLL